MYLKKYSNFLHWKVIQGSAVFQLYKYCIAKMGRQDYSFLCSWPKHTVLLHVTYVSLRWEDKTSVKIIRFPYNCQLYWQHKTLFLIRNCSHYLQSIIQFSQNFIVYDRFLTHRFSTFYIFFLVYWLKYLHVLFFHYHI